MSERRAGFTAVELLVVIGIMMILLGIAVPTVMPAIRRGKINSGVNDITTCWRQARLLAMTTTAPPGARPPHFGIVINQTAGQQPYVALIFDNVAAGTPNFYMQGQDPHDPAGYNASGTPATYFKLNRNVIIASSATPSGGPVSTADNSIIIYAQYGTGLPISPAQVAANHGSIAAPVSLGVDTPSAASSTVCPVVRLQTLDYETVPQRRGFATNFSIYHAGFTSAQEL